MIEGEKQYVGIKGELSQNQVNKQLTPSSGSLILRTITSAVALMALEFPPSHTDTDAQTQTLSTKLCITR